MHQNWTEKIAKIKSKDGGGAGLKTILCHVGLRLKHAKILEFYLEQIKLRPELPRVIVMIIKCNRFDGEKSNAILTIIFSKFGS